MTPSLSKQALWLIGFGLVVGTAVSLAAGIEASIAFIPLLRRWAPWMWTLDTTTAREGRL